MKFTINNNFLSKTLNLKDDTVCLNNNIKSFHKRNEKEPLDKLSFINKINNLKNENNSETFEKLIKEEADRIKIPTQKKEHLKNIDLIENNIPQLYNWKTLFNNSIPINRYISVKKGNIHNKNKRKQEKETITEKLTINNYEHNEISPQPDNNQPKNKKKKFHSFNKNNKINDKSSYNKNKSNNNNNYSNIDYSKGINVLCKLPNEFLINYYKDLNDGRKNTQQLSPKIKLKNNNIRNEIKSERILSFNKEIKLNILISNEIENEKFKNEDLIITAKRKNADILVKSFFEKEIEKLDDDTKKYFKTLKPQEKSNNYNKSSRNLFRKNNKKTGLILSFYDENNPCLKIFSDAMENLGENNNKVTDNAECEVIRPTLKRNIFSASNFNFMDIGEYNPNNENENNYKYDSIDSKKNKINKNRKRIPIVNNYFKTNDTQRNKIYPINTNEEYINYDNQLRRPMSSSNLKSKNHKKYGFNEININDNGLNMPYQLKTINFIQSFPIKSSSKVGNTIYDRINRIIKSKSYKKYSLKTKKNNKKSIKLKCKTHINNYEYSDEESKGNKIIPKYYDNNNNKNNKKLLSKGYIKNTNYYFFEDDYKYENIKNKLKVFDTKSILRNIKKEFCNYPLTIHNKLGNNYYSCSNNYIINYKRKNKNKYLRDYSDNVSLNDILSEILSEDK